MKNTLMSGLQLQRWQPGPWLRDHVRHRCDGHLCRTRVFSKPRGAAPRGAVKNKRFDATLGIELA